MFASVFELPFANTMRHRLARPRTGLSFLNGPLYMSHCRPHYSMGIAACFDCTLIESEASVQEALVEPLQQLE